MRIARDAKDAKITLADEKLLDDHAKKLLVGMKKKINERRKYEAVRVVMTEAEEEARMHVEYAARMAVEQAALMASGEWSVAFDFALACLDFVCLCFKLLNCDEFAPCHPCACLL